MWKERLWKKEAKSFFKTACGKVLNSAHPLCGKKAVVALKDFPSFHINFP
jgi:hypothetical protein